MHRQVDRSRARRVLPAVLLGLSLPLLALGGIAAAAGGGASPATGITCPPGQTPVTTPTGVVCVVSTGGGTSTSASPTGGGGGGGGGGNTCYTAWDHSPVPCYVAGEGWYDADIACWVELEQPQPPASDPLWQGRTPGDGAIWQATCPGANGPGYKPLYDFWAANPPVGQSPTVLLSTATAELVMHGPAIGTAPKTGGLTLVGLPVWMWTTVSKQTWGPQTVTVTADGMTLTATAKATKIVWNMGDGNSITCDNPGTMYQTSYGAASSPTCGYTYDTSAVYHVTATAYWMVTWTASELGIQISEGTATPPPVQSATTVHVGELQVLNNG